MDDNYGAPEQAFAARLARRKQGFANRIALMDDEEFVKIAEEYIWLSAYANNNPRSDYHWMCDAAYDEAKRRGKPELYDRAHKQASGA